MELLSTFEFFSLHVFLFDLYIYSRYHSTLDSITFKVGLLQQILIFSHESVVDIEVDEDEQQQNWSRQQGKQCQRKHRPYKQAYTAAAENKEMQQQHELQQQQQEPRHNNQEYHPLSKITKRQIYLSKITKKKKYRMKINVF